MNARDRWIDEGLRVLCEEGVAGVRIDRIAARLELTKGSFHHHFRGVEDYRRALLARYEKGVTASIEDAAAAARDLPPAQAIAALPAVTRLDAPLESAIRGWAAQDGDARATIERTDAARLRLLTELWAAAVGDLARARAAALIPHLIAIGASVAVPRPADDDLAGVFALLVQLVPFVEAESGGAAPTTPPAR